MTKQTREVTLFLAGFAVATAMFVILAATAHG